MPPIRLVGPDAAEDIARLLPFVHDWHVAAYPHVFKPNPPLDQVAAHIRQLLEQPGALALLTGVPASGYLIALRRDRSESPFSRGEKRLFIDQIAVDPAARRQGHGKALIDAARAHARDQGCAALFLDSWADNTRAHAFFRAVGFDASRSLFEARIT